MVCRIDHCSQSLARAGPVGSVLLTVPSNQGGCFIIGRLESQGGRPCPRNPSFHGAEASLRRPRGVPREETGRPEAGEVEGGKGAFPTPRILLGYTIFEKSPGPHEGVGRPVTPEF